MSDIARAAALYDEIRAAQDEADRTRAAAKEADERLEEKKAAMLALLNDAGVSSLKFPTGTVSKSVRWSVRTPATPGAKAEFFAFLQGRGEYDELRTVNYQALNGWYKRVIEEAKEGGDIDFSVPGLEPPTAQEILSIRKG